MKETNPLETQLRSWQPRRPSARLKRRLFGLSIAPGAAWIFGSLAPAAACALLTLSVWGSRNDMSVVTPLPGLMASNWNQAAFSLDGFADKQNHWVCVTFDSTNRSGLGSNRGSFPLSK
jgi:hypothetical protein